MRKNNRGFTLVELVVSIALLALILIPASSLFTSSFEAQGRSSMKTSITRVGQYVMENFKNKNYLGLKPYGEESGLMGYIQDKTVDELVDLNITGDTGWELEYNGVDYIVDLKLVDAEKHDIFNIDIPKKFDAHIKINEDGKFYSCKEDDDGEIEIVNLDSNIMSQVAVGGTVISPLNSDKNFKANYPTLILNSNYPGTTDGSSKTTLLITNEKYFNDKNSNALYEKGEDNQKYIRIIKDFTDELEVYIEGINLLIKKGQEGDGASKDYTKITSSYIGEVSENNKERSSSEVVLKAEMTISYAKDENLRDTFAFSFPVDYDYSN